MQALSRQQCKGGARLGGTIHQEARLRPLSSSCRAKRREVCVGMGVFGCSRTQRTTRALKRLKNTCNPYLPTHTHPQQASSSGKAPETPPPASPPTPPTPSTSTPTNDEPRYVREFNALGGKVVESNQAFGGPEDEADFWEGDKFSAFGDALEKYFLPFLVLLGVGIGALAARTYNEGATAYVKNAGSPDDEMRIIIAPEVLEQQAQQQAQQLQQAPALVE